MDEIIQFQGKDYLCRYIDTEHGLFLIAEDDLESNLFDEKNQYVSEEAKQIDERVFFYVPASILFMNKLYVENYLYKNAIQEHFRA